MNKLLVSLVSVALVLSACAAPVAQSTVAPVLSPTPEPTSTQGLPTLTSTAEPSPTPTLTPVPVSPEEVVAYEMKGAFDFFWEQANTDPDSPGYGLIRDRYPGSEGIASIASLGFGLTAYIIGVEKGYISYEQAFERVRGAR